MRNACLERLKYEARHPAVQLGDVGDEFDPLTLIPGMERELGAELEAKEELAALVRRGRLTKAQRAKVERLKAR